MASRKGQRDEARHRRQEEEQAAAQAARRRRLTQLTVGGVFAMVIVVVAIVVLSKSGGGGGNAADISGAATVTKELAGIEQNGSVLGDPQAKVTVVEFADPQCPVCKDFAEQVLPQLIAGPVSDGQADYEYKPWLIIGPDSEPAARAALAAGEQGRLFEYIALFYRNQGVENSGYVTDDFLTAIAKAAGVADLDKWNSDRASSKWTRELAAVDSEATGLGLSGTPTVQVVGPGGKKVLPGVPSEAQLEAAINAAGQ